MLYVASPYSSPIVGIEEQRYQRVRAFTERMIAQGFVAFSPILYCHPIAKRIGHKTDAATWMSFNMSILRRCEAMYVLCLPGWKESKGLEVELKVAGMLHMPVAHYDEMFRLVDEHWQGHLVGQF